MLSTGSRQSPTANVLIKAASGEKQNIMFIIEMSSISTLLFSFYRQNPGISTQAVVTDGDENRVEVARQRLSVVVLLQLSLRSREKRIYHDELPANSSKTSTSV